MSDDDNVRRLFPGAEPTVVDAELVEDEYTARQREQARRRREGYKRDVVVAGRAVKFVATHSRTKRAGKAALRHVSYVFGGAWVLAVRLWEAKSSSGYERVMRKAEVANNFVLLGEWEARREGFKMRRHTRAMNWVHAPGHFIKALAIGIAAFAGLLLAIGGMLAMANGDASLVLGPVVGFLNAIRWMTWFVAAYGALALILITSAVIWGLWHVGRASEMAPQWTMPAGQLSDAGAPITPSIVVKALRDLGIPTLRNAIKDMGDAGAGMLGPITIAGCGVEVDVLLPSGVNTKAVQDKRRGLAENLSRHEHEVFITVPPAARTVRLWIADSGALDEPIGPSPLVVDPDMTGDLYNGRAPWGQDLRGDAVAVSLLQRHLLITGLSNQGKTAALRALVLWLALDPTTEFRIADLKGVGDWRMFTDLASVLIQGPTDEHVMAATEMLEEGVREMERRIAALEASGATDGVTRDMARKPGSGFHPVFLIVDEAQVAFMCPAVGEDKRPYGGTKATSRYFMAARKILNQGRVVNVLLYQGTQDPTDQNLPKMIRESAHIRASLVVGTEQQARMALGEKAVDGGAAPHRLRVGADKGTVVVAGDGVPLPAGQSAMTIRTHFVDGVAAAEVAETAKARRGERASVGPAEAERDVLADVAEVLGTDTAVKATDVCARLRELAPGHRAYDRLGAEKLASLLAADGVPVKKSDGLLTVRARLVQAALADRDDE